MTKRILAPIDARERSEAIMPVVAALARDSGASVRLLRVFPVPYVDQEMARLTDEGLEDLARVATAFAGVPVECVVRFGEPEDEIRLEAEAFHADLIALATDKRGRLRRALTPTLADRIAGKTSIPSLVLHG